MDLILNIIGRLCNNASLSESGKHSNGCWHCSLWTFVLWSFNDAWCIYQLIIKSELDWCTIFFMK